MFSKNAVQEYLRESSEGKKFWGRSFILIWSFIVLKYISQNQEVPPFYNPLWVVSHGIHEIGHWVTKPFGMWVSVASGSIFQFFFPFVFFVAMLRSRDMHGAFVLLTWQAASLIHMAHYAGSAEYSDLIMDTPHFVTMYHDWVWMLSQLNAISFARTIEGFFYFLSWFFGLTSLLGQVASLGWIWKWRESSSSQSY
jgi:hypothetical protein